MSKIKSILIFSLLIFCLLVIFVFSATFSQNQYVAKLGNDKIYLNEYYTYFNMQVKNFEQKGGAGIWQTDFEGTTALEQAKNNALKAIVMVENTNKKLGKNYTLSTDEINEENKLVEKLYNSYDDDTIQKYEITKTSLQKLIYKSDIYTKIVNDITKNFTVSKEKQDKAYIDYLNTFKLTLNSDSSEEDKKNKEDFEKEYYEEEKGKFFQDYYEKNIENRKPVINEKVWKLIGI